MLDIEELADVGLPARLPTPAESPWVEAIARSLVDYATAGRHDVIELAAGPPEAGRRAAGEEADRHRDGVERGACAA